MDLILHFDNYILDLIQNTVRCDFFDFIMPVITFLGENGILWIILGLILMLFKKTRAAGISILVALLIGLIVCNITLKPLVARVRPYDANGFTDLIIKPLSDYSFPSGHTVAAFEMAVCVCVFNRKYGILSLIVAVLIGFSRLYLYVHYPSDVIAGAIIGTVIATAVALAVKSKATRYN